MARDEAMSITDGSLTIRTCTPAMIAGLFAPIMAAITSPLIAALPTVRLEELCPRPAGEAPLSGARGLPYHVLHN